ncbi:unnamed protein product, partial [marine sediment metagenome]
VITFLDSSDLKFILISLIEKALHDVGQCLFTVPFSP